jgi:hypothetical protein
VEEKITSLLDLPTDITKKEILSHLALKDLSILARTSQGAQKFFANVLADAKLAALLQHVAFGEQEQAERILKADPTLLLRTGQVTDYSGRTFKNITAFQYALWALDRHMWTMILKYLPREEGAKQLHDHVYNTKAYKDKHGDYYYFVPLIDASQTYVDNFDNWTDGQKVKHWCEVLGGAQFLAPAHVANEYCLDDRSFNPTPTFKEDKLPRSLTFYNYLIPGNSHWFQRARLRRLGLDFAIEGGCSRFGRGGHNQASAKDGEFVLGRRGAFDLAAMTALCKVRTDELVELKQLLLNPAQAPEALTPPPEKSSCVIS